MNSLLFSGRRNEEIDLYHVMLAEGRKQERRRLKIRKGERMHSGLPYSKELVAQLSEKAVRDEFVADQVRSRIAMLIRTLREQEERGWSQTELGRRMGKPPNVVSRLENPDYGKMGLQTLLEVAAAFDLPLLVDMPEWEDWFVRISGVSKQDLSRRSYHAHDLIERHNVREDEVASGKVIPLNGTKLKQVVLEKMDRPRLAETSSREVHSLNGASIRRDQPAEKLNDETIKVTALNLQVRLSCPEN